MNTSRLAALAAAYFVTPVCALASPADAATAVPIVVDACTAASNAGKATTAPTVWIVFRNQGSAPVDAVDFRVAWRSGAIDTIHDAGNFPSGTTIRHAFRAAPRAAYGDALVACTVASAHVR